MADGASTEATARKRWPGDRFRVSGWFAIAIGLLAVVTLIGVVAGVAAIVRLSDARGLVVDRADPSAIEAARLSNALVDQESGLRGFVLAGEERFLRPYRAGRRGELTASARLRALPDGPHASQLRDDLTAVQRAAGTWHGDYARPTIATVRARGADSVSRSSVARGKLLFDRVRAATARLRTDVALSRADARESLRDAATTLSAAFGAVAVLIAIALLTTTIMLRRTVTLPVGALARRVRRVAQGEFDRPVRSRGPRDIAALAADIDTMRRRILDELEEVRAAHAQLDAQARELARSNAELEQFAYVASHDLQEPLRKVASFCQLLEQRYKGELDERADQYIDFAVDGAKRMQQLINDLLAFSRVGRTSGALVPIDLDDVLERALDNLAAAIEESGAAIEADPLPRIRGEASLLTLVLQNLIGNAIKFRSESAPRVHVTVERQGNDWLISCSDNGIGIDAEYAERVFVIFQRLHPKDDYPGTGIGLAMSRKIVEYHGGRIWLDAEAPTGATFRFTLPALEEDR